jgi:iron/zinc/copper transport system substrate-binding protein
VPIAGKLYTDALGPEGSSAETYIGMMKYNVHTLLKGLR